MSLHYLLKYQTFSSVQEMNKVVKEHIRYHYDKLTESNKSVLYCLSRHSLTAIGASHLLISTISEEVCVSERTVQRSIKVLTDLGIIMKYKTVKRTGRGASIYVIAPKIKRYNVSYLTSESCQSLETHVSLTATTDSHVINETESKNLITSSFNHFVVSNVVNNVNACDTHDLKSSLRNIWNPQDNTQHKEFNELCKIAFGRLKQYMKEKSIPYMQMQQIIIQCMRSLVIKDNVRNKFALFSAMIKRQVEQLFESNITLVSNGMKALKYKSKEIIPDWFEGRKSAPVQSDDVSIDFEAERQKILNQLGGC